MQDEAERLFKKQQEMYFQGNTRPLSFRKKQLERLKEGIMAYEKQIFEALDADLGKSNFESFETEIGLILGEIRLASKKLSKWAAPKRVGGPILQFPSAGVILPEPKGCVLILSPWNYPVQLTLAPLVSAIAAGNCAILGLPPDATHTSVVLIKMISETFPSSYIAARIGTIEENTRLLKLPFQHIFFTGSPRVGRIVMEAAAKNLTPVTLELGGKSPCIVDASADIELAAKRILWGKCINAGQTCVAPDYLLVHESVCSRLAVELKKQAERFYPGGMLTSPDFARIVNEKHFTRLKSLLEGQTILMGGRTDGVNRKIELTVVQSPSPDSAVMTEEIFGPILPMLSYQSLDEAIAFIRNRPNPLALYLFASDRQAIKKVFDRVSYGGGCLNDTVVHITAPNLPFGGVGESGMGSCHGKAGFDTFTHLKPLLKRGAWLDLPVRYPPYKDKLKALKKLMR